MAKKTITILLEEAFWQEWRAAYKGGGATKIQTRYHDHYRGTDAAVVTVDGVEVYYVVEWSHRGLCPDRCVNEKSYVFSSITSEEVIERIAC